MSLTAAERRLLERRLARRRRSGAAVVTGVALLAAALPIALVVSFFVGVGVVYASLAEELEGGLAYISNLRERSTFESIKIYDRNGVLLREIFTEGRRTKVPLAEIPLVIRQATIAVEDATFYENPGIDPVGIARAFSQFALQGEIVSGGSTITQQYVRHVAFPYEERVARSYNRKLKEIVLALVMTERYSKNDILEGYLNEIYYGNLSYGIEAAAQTVFGKSARELDLAEAALLAGLPQSPWYLDPLSPDPDVHDAVRARQRIVLDLMARAGFVTEAEADAAYNEKLVFRDASDQIFRAPHFVVYVTKLLEGMMGPERMARGGLVVTTSLDYPLQVDSEAAVREHVDALRDAHDLTNAAAVVLEPRTGQVLALVGSYDFWNEEIDGEVNVAARLRQPGSSIKPVTYATALEQGIPASTMLWDVPMKRDTPQGLYEPVNYDGRFHGPVRLRTALANSYNIPALKLMERVGVKEMIHTANAMGITTLDPESDRYGLSLTLGGGEVTLLDLSTAFGTLANGGEMVRANPILKIATTSGETLYNRADDAESLTPARALDPATAYIITDILSDNNARTPAFGPRSPLATSIKTAAKTGTTNDYRDNWTVGYTPNVVVGIWAGNSDNHPMRFSSGVTGAAPIWHDILESIARSDDRQEMIRHAREAFGFPYEDGFTRPKNVVERPVCALDSLNNLGPACSSTRTELFVQTANGQQPTPATAPGGATPELVPSVAGGYDAWTVVPAVAVPQPAPPAHEGFTPPSWTPALLCHPAGPGRGLERTYAIAVLPLPTEPDERSAVIAWSAADGWVALQPSTVCSPEMAAAALDLGDAAAWTEAVPGLDAAGLTGLPTTPRSEYRLGLAAGTVLTRTTSLTGTVVFDPNAVDYYKVELGAGQAPTEWITLGDTHSNFVVNGPLEVLDAPSLAPGDYIVRLVLVRRDGNFLRPTYDVPIRVAR